MPEVRIFVSNKNENVGTGFLSRRKIFRAFLFPESLSVQIILELLSQIRLTVHIRPCLSETEP